jgi:hypothetical protein
MFVYVDVFHDYHSYWTTLIKSYSSLVTHGVLLSSSTTRGYVDNNYPFACHNRSAIDVISRIDYNDIEGIGLQTRYAFSRLTLHTFQPGFVASKDCVLYIFKSHSYE